MPGPKPSRYVFKLEVRIAQETHHVVKVYSDGEELQFAGCYLTPEEAKDVAERLAKSLQARLR